MKHLVIYYCCHCNVSDGKMRVEQQITLSSLQVPKNCGVDAAMTCAELWSLRVWKTLLGVQPLPVCVTDNPVDRMREFRLWLQCDLGAQPSGVLHIVSGWYVNQCFRTAHQFRL